MPIISQWPVTESLPADASAMRPTAARGGRPAIARVDTRLAVRAVDGRRGPREPVAAGEVGEGVLEGGLCGGAGRLFCGGLSGYEECPAEWVPGSEIVAARQRRSSRDR